MRNRRFITIFIFFTVFNWFYVFSTSILPLHIFQQGININQQIFGQIIRFIAELMVLFVFVALNAKFSWRIALILFLAYILLLVKIISPLQFYLASALNGMSVFFFYIFYNTAHFENTPKVNTGHSSALMHSMPAIVSIIAPLVAGYILMVSPTVAWLLSGLFFIISFLLINKQVDFQIHYDVKRALKEIHSTRFFILVEGILESLIFGVIPIYTLSFIKTPLRYGVFLSYLSLIGALSNIVFGRYTDRLKRRSIFLYPITIIMAVVTFLFINAVNNITLWIIATGIIQFLLPLFWNSTTALVVDAHENLRLAIPGREICLAFGKAIGMIIVYASFILEKKPFFLFITLAAMMLLFPLTLFWRTRIKKTHLYF